MASPIGVLVGPTASGKSELALALARRLPIEIIVADSRQVFRGMDVGTAKPDRAARHAVPHHLIDLVHPSQRFSVADWVARARDLIPRIADRGRLPLVVGGTGLYVAALVDGYRFDPESHAPERRALLLAQLEDEGLEALASRLASIVPGSATRIDVRNPRRVVRALERLTGDAAPDASRPHATPYPGPLVMLGLRRPRVELYRRIDERAAAIFASGLLDEVRALREAGFGAGLAPMSGHGYREATDVLEGRVSVAGAIADTARRTRQYAKRQMTWFRRDRRITWIDAVAGEAHALPIVERAMELLHPVARQLLEPSASG